MMFKFDDELAFCYTKTNGLNDRDGFDVWLCQWRGFNRKLLVKFSHHTTRRDAKVAVKRRNNGPREVKTP